MKISDKSVREICKIGQSKACCRYLVMGTNGFDCLKNTHVKAILDTRANNNLMTAQGDNCDGMKD